VFLILKESVTNVAKHAQGATAHVTFACDRRRLRLQIRDDGQGFDPTCDTDGNGLRSMGRRVRAIGGRFDIESSPGRGTTVTLDVPLGYAS
jgi:signal transduction histidine kinase